MQILPELSKCLPCCILDTSLEMLGIPAPGETENGVMIIIS